MQAHHELRPASRLVIIGRIAESRRTTSIRNIILCREAVFKEVLPEFPEYRTQLIQATIDSKQVESSIRSKPYILRFYSRDPKEMSREVFSDLLQLQDNLVSGMKPEEKESRGYRLLNSGLIREYEEHDYPTFDGRIGYVTPEELSFGSEAEPAAPSDNSNGKHIHRTRPRKNGYHGNSMQALGNLIEKKYGDPFFVSETDLRDYLVNHRHYFLERVYRGKISKAMKDFAELRSIEFTRNMFPILSNN